MSVRSPDIGQVTPEYPRGYGYCQCGCGKVTKRHYTGEYSKYVDSRHHPNAVLRRERKRQKRAKQLAREAEHRRKALEKARAKRLSVSPEARRRAALATGTLGEIKPRYEFGWGYCQCGCGRETKITHGRAARFVSGHSSRTVEARERASRVGTQVLQNRIRSGSLPLGKSIHGMHFSALNDREMSFMSTYEQRAFEILDVLDNVASYEEQPYPITYEYRGAKSQYTPDVLVRFKDNRIALVEIKPRSQLASAKVVAKAQAAAAFCAARGSQYMIWTEDFLRLQDFKRRCQQADGVLIQYCKIEYIETVVGMTVNQIDARLAKRRGEIHAAFHPRA